MKKVQKALALGLSLALCAGVFVACGDDPEPEANTTPGEKSVYYVVGDLNDPYYSDLGLDLGNWAGQHCAAIEDISEKVGLVTTTTRDVYELRGLKLHEGEKFQILVAGQAWNGQMGYSYLKGNDEGNFANGGGLSGTKDIETVTSGIYTITLNMRNSDTPVITYERTDDVAPLPNPVKGITLNKTSIGLELPEEGGDAKTFQIETTVNPADADEKDDITYVSNHPEFATVSDAGLVTAVAKGTATITVTCGTKTAELTVIVVNHGELVVAEEIELEQTELTVHVGQKETLVATVTPDAALDFDAIVWSSDDTDVATVDAETGEVTAVAPGTAKITATIGSGADEKTAECEVTVPVDFYLVGSSANGYFGFNTQASYEAAETAKLLFTEQEDKVYVIENVTFYAGDQFKVLTLGKGWSDALGGLKGGESVEAHPVSFDVDDEAVEHEVYADNDADNIGVAKSGVYKITVTVGETTKIKLEKTSTDVAKLSEKKIFIKGATIPGMSGWQHEFSDDYKLEYDSEKDEYFYELNVNADVATSDSNFGFALYEMDATEGDGVWIGNPEHIAEDKTGKFSSCSFSGVDAGKYRFTIKFTETGWKLFISTAVEAAE